MKRILGLYMLLLSLHLTAQECEYFPADCPDEGSIEASKKPSVRLGNGLLLQEIKMQDKMRSLVTEMIFRAAKILHWQPVELDELTNLGPFQSGSTV